MMTETAFNSAPIMLQPPTKTSSSSTMMTSEQDILSSMFYHSHASSSYYQDEDDEDDVMLPVPQHLDSEQINYEFPPKSHLKALSYLDQLEEEYSFFDETSFTSLSNDSSSSASSLLSGYFEDLDEQSSITTPPKSFFSSLIDGKDLDLTRISHHMLTEQPFEYHGILKDQSSSSRHNIVDDSKLSPLQLPAQAEQQQWVYHQREQSCDSSTTITKEAAIVAPQSFLSMPLYKSNHHVDQSSSFVYSSTTGGVTQTESSSRRYSDEGLDLPIIISETEPILEQDHGDDNSMTSDYLYPQQQTVIIKISSKHSTNSKQPYRRPTSLTYLASDEGYDDDDRDEKLGIDCEIESASVFLPLEQDDEDTRVNTNNDLYGNEDMTQAMWTTFLQQQKQWTVRIQRLEQQLDEERAMRQAFEKAMEDMTVVMDQQQKVLYDRLEQEISMREAYEHKMQQTVAHVQPLEQQLEKESAARVQLEETMVQVLNQLECLQTQHQQHVNDDTAQHKRMQKKLDQALNDITSSSTITASASSSNGVTKSAARPTASGTITNTKSSHSRTTTITNKPGTSSIVRTKTTTTPQSRSRPSKVSSTNKRSTPTPVAKSGPESQQQKQASTSSSRRLVFHR